MRWYFSDVKRGGTMQISVGLVKRFTPAHLDSGWEETLGPAPFLSNADASRWPYLSKSAGQESPVLRAYARRETQVESPPRTSRTRWTNP